MTLRSPRRPLATLAAAAVLGAGALSGCSAADAGLHPGAAAVVGDETVELEAVEEAAEGLCQVLQSAPQTQGRSYPMRLLRTAAQRGLALNEMAEQLAAEYDVDVSEGLVEGTEAVQVGYGLADEQDLEAAMPTFTGDGHLDLVLVAIGQEDLGGDATEDEARARGYEIGRAWVEENGLRSNPAFEQLTLGDLEVEGTRADLSVPASDWARRAVDPESQQEADAATAELPAAQRCAG